MMVAVRTPHLQLDVVVMHAPHTGADDESRLAWWEYTAATIFKWASSDVDLCVMADTNLQMGAQTSEAVGPLAAPLFKSSDHSLPRALGATPP